VLYQSFIQLLFIVEKRYSLPSFLGSENYVVKTAFAFGYSGSFFMPGFIPVFAVDFDLILDQIVIQLPSADP
jgi:hypothetical protein